MSREDFHRVLCVMYALRPQIKTVSDFKLPSTSKPLKCNSKYCEDIARESHGAKRGGKMGRMMPNGGICGGAESKQAFQATMTYRQFLCLDLCLIKVAHGIMGRISVRREGPWSGSAIIQIGSVFGVRCSEIASNAVLQTCLLYTSPSPRDRQKSRMPSSA